MGRITGWLALFFALAAPLAAQKPWTAVDADPAVLEAAAVIYRQVRTEVVFCIEGRYDPQTETYHVDALVLAPQMANAGDGARFDCTGYDGWVHNHRDRGSRYCAMSLDDRTALAEEPDMILAIGWCRDGAWFHAFAP